MNTTRHLTRLTMIAAMAAFGFSILPAHAADKNTPVIQLPTVVVTGKKIPVVQLERVVVTGKRVAPATLLAQRGQRNPV